MNKNILEFYVLANELKNVVRTGWVEVGIPREKVESVADHVYGSLVLSIAIVSEKNIDIDLEKVFKMIIVKELKKAINKEEASINSVNDGSVEVILNKLSNKEELMNLYEEAENKETKEAKFALMVTKLESDIQAKIYEKNGDFTVENAKKDIENYPEELKSQLINIEKASDGWLTYDRQYYTDELFMSLSKDVQEL